MRTYSPKPGDVQRQWHVIDATDVVLGRLATQAATLLRGKHKPIFAPHVDTGDFVIIINADKVALTGNKREQQAGLPPLRLPGRPARHARTPSCSTSTPSRPSRRPSRACCRTTRSAAQMLSKLKVYAGPEHPHAAQQPHAVRDHPGRAVARATDLSRAPRQQRTEST